MKTVVVIGPYSGKNAWEVEQNVRLAETMCLAVAELGAAPISLNVMGRFWNGTRTHDQWMEVAKTHIRFSDAVVVISDRSVGVQAEIAYAEGLKIPVFGSLQALEDWLAQESHHRSDLEEAQAAFEKEAADWGLDFERHPDKEDQYLEFETGLTFGSFLLGWQAHQRKP